MTRILANYKNLAMTSDNLALVAHFLDRRTYLHNSIPFGYAHTLFYVARPAAGDRFPNCFLLAVALRSVLSTQNAHTRFMSCANNIAT